MAPLPDRARQLAHVPRERSDDRAAEPRLSAHRVKRGQRQTQGNVIRQHPGQANRTEILCQRAGPVLERMELDELGGQAAGRGAELVTYSRVGSEAHSPARQPEPPAQIGLL